MNLTSLPVLVAALVATQCIAQTTTRDSLTSAGVQDPNLGSFTPALSQDGRYLAFASGSPNLVTGDTNNTGDIFCRDRLTGQTTRVSVSSAGAQGNGNSLDPDISADGRFIVFRSAASNLVAGDTNNVPDIFCHDRQTATTTRVSVGTGGQQITQFSDGGAISGDGRYVVFESADGQITAGDWCVTTDVFCHDRQTGITTLISASLIAFQQFNPRRRPNISFDGGAITFDSAADDLTLNDTNGWNDVFVWSRLTNSISCVSIASSGAQANERSEDAVISPDGRFVAFTSFAFNFIPGDTNSPDVFVRDLQTGQLTWCSSGLAGAFADQPSYVTSISGDGRFVCFWGGATNLVPGDTNGVWDVFVFDRVLGTTTRASVGTTGTQGNGQSNSGRISSDGRCIAFQSAATNLVVPDANLSVQDVYVRDRGTTASLTFYGAGCPGTGLEVPAITNVGWPLIGNAAFGVGVGNGLASSLAVVCWSTTSANVPFSGCDVLVGAPVNMQPAVFLDASGAGVTPFPIPNDPLLADVDVFFQALVVDVNGPFLNLGALSNGLATRIGN